jgi:hypothetical protein
LRPEARSLDFFLDFRPNVIHSVPVDVLTLCPLEIEAMRTTLRKILVLTVSLVLIGGMAARAQDGPGAKPTAEHEMLKHDVGTWDATVKSWMQGPQSEPSVSQGVERSKLMPGGLWVLSEFEGKFGDMEFHGAGATGYDTQKKKYVGVWVDSMSNSLMTMEGDYDADTKTVTMHSKGTDPAGKPYEAKMVSVHKDKDTRVFTMSMKGDGGGEFVKIMEITYTRRHEK